MGLQKYLSKRNLQKSKEPSRSQSKKSSSSLHFCIQKHDARRLHYDFRLECNGVLLSWAVPKGPSMDPKDKRLAIHVEDHPLDYQHFEGTIPPGNYGAGTVEIWDRGDYVTPRETDRKKIEKEISEGLRKGHFSIILYGKKLHGEFVFQKLKKDPDDKSWLLIKKGDSSSSISIKSKTKKMKEKIPQWISPMLGTLVKEAFNDKNWLFEIKWDGFRGLAFINKGKVELLSRNQLLLNEKFPVIVKELQKIDNHQVILDGELVILDEKGRPSFQLMQNYQTSGTGALYFYVFDLLYIDGEDIRQLPLLQRKEMLHIFLDGYQFSRIRFCSHILENGVAFFQEATKAHLEGIMGKEKNSVYESRRSKKWVKIKCMNRQEVVIGGFTSPRGSRSKFGALLVGIYNATGELDYCGHVGGGFNHQSLVDVYERLEEHQQKDCPFQHVPKANEKVTWVKPILVCEVSFSEWTKDHRMRHPIFHGMRDDKSPKKVTREIPKQVKRTIQSSKKKEDLALTNLEKIYWPKEGYTKGDLINYYKTISKFILPYLKDRPITLHRYPNGIEGIDFYQKDIGLNHPDWIKTFEVHHETKIDHYLNIHDLASLLYAINLGSIDLHPFLSRYQKLDAPDYCLIDLDPHDISFSHVITIAHEIHEILDAIEVPHYCKTSGGKGLHILIPLQGKCSFEESKEFAQIICYYVNAKYPTITSIERSPKKRAKKIYLDCLQNRSGQTMVAPYSVRPRPGALVSTPLEWKEVNDKLLPANYTIDTVPGRLEKKGDLFAKMKRESVNLKKIMVALKRHFLNPH